MVPNTLLHMYADNFWIDLGKATNSIAYFNDIIWEHLHPDNGKAHRDTQYQYAASVVNHDLMEYQNYLNNGQFNHDISSINSLKTN